MSSEAQNLMIEVIDAHAYNGADVGFDMVRAEYCICGWSEEGDGVRSLSGVESMTVRHPAWWSAVTTARTCFLLPRTAGRE
ncbi:hypothetical protein PBI_VELVETEEN_77 [Mycobacterium phage Velveteen]|uniref:hypothetical protein n=1 Tax=Mycobacterium phage Velveteen TaxID=1340821 RepID=UPI000387F5CF|nr:hypothetical protein N858_gp077 [Mycobacterium phage Velveteen]YP_009125930.1 hypothetical protein VC45_gp077 [Mycobacterium phage Cerasum]ARM70675.1 hypothetical protein SEA_KINGSLEY_87 [Mycobacterium phage Kingsley]AVR76468.1 hypothetical protein SEA_BIGPHIL_76 [Mycobacterium phage BigPhil]QOP65518.1 hypothetical protein SEA_COCO12_80 [Mycobacterium phage Coco12]QXO12884.1 hypothetical protein SEA_LATRETIUM_84 [Mycobacterium phage Latretium]QZD98559.1 hypothetical protein SEA_SARMA624_82